MKNIISSFILLNCICIATDTQSVSHTDTTAIERPTHLVFRRYYFIARLEKTIKLLKEIVSNAPKNDIRKIANCSEMPKFSHTLVLEAAYRIQQAKSLKPIFVVWDDFSSYKSLEAEIVIGKDDLFIKEFSQQLFFIAKNILSTTKPIVYKTLSYDLKTVIAGSPEQILDSLDYLVELIQSDNTCKVHKKTYPDIKIHASADEINIRFYYIKRLSCIVDLIQVIEQKKSPIHRSIHPIASEDIQYIQSTWSQIKQYRRIGDQDYIQNFCILLFNVLKASYQQTPAESDQDGFLTKLEVEDILYSLDVIADELNGVIDEYNQHEKTSLKEWITTYWWIPLTTLSSIALKLIHYHYTGQK